MFATILAILPAIALLIFIYFKDKKEKEPVSFLIGCLFFGILSVFPILIVETIEDEIFAIGITNGSVAYAITNGFIVAGLTEEFFKLLFLRLKTWKSKNFDCMFDGIVYSVYVSLGFALVENIMYVFDGGISVAVLRMLTSLPGHTSFAVYMGFFYSKAKLAQVKGNKKEYKMNMRLALIIPVLIHGLYDCLIMAEEEVAGEIITALFALAWIAFVVALFIFTFVFVNIASKNDDFILISPEGDTKVVPRAYVGTWTCSNGHVCAKNFCGVCGEARPVIKPWNCKNCGETAYYKFCHNCGTAHDL